MPQWYLRAESPIGREAWPKIIHQYCLCDLTRSQDKFVALSGLARLIAENTGDIYIAGLWRSDLEHQLAWRVERTLQKSPSSRPAEYRAPTWSWASLDGAFIVLPHGEKTAAERIMAVHMHKVEVQPRYANSPFGEVSAAKLRLRCNHFYRWTGSIFIRAMSKRLQAVDIAGVSVKVVMIFDRPEIVCKDGRTQIYLLLIESYLNQEEHTKIIWA